MLLTISPIQTISYRQSINQSDRQTVLLNRFNNHNLTCDTVSFGGIQKPYTEVAYTDMIAFFDSLANEVIRGTATELAKKKYITFVNYVLRYVPCPLNEPFFNDEIKKTIALINAKCSTHKETIYAFKGKYSQNLKNTNRMVKNSLRELGDKLVSSINETLSNDGEVKINWPTDEHNFKLDFEGAGNLIPLLSESSRELITELTNKQNAGPFRTYGLSIELCKAYLTKTLSHPKEAKSFWNMMKDAFTQILRRRKPDAEFRWENFTSGRNYGYYIDYPLYKHFSQGEIDLVKMILANRRNYLLSCSRFDENGKLLFRVDSSEEQSPFDMIMKYNNFMQCKRHIGNCIGLAKVIEKIDNVSDLNCWLDRKKLKKLTTVTTVETGM